MSYLAFTQAAASWFLGKSALIDALHDAFVQDPAHSALQETDEFVEGPFRIAFSSAKKITCIWNVDYISGTGDEPWGFIALSGQHGISFVPAISREVFERCIYVISQRLQALTIDGALFPRSYPSGAHTCLAGRGSEARHSSIGYYERHVGEGELRQQAIICVGPEQNWKIIESASIAAGRDLPALVIAANQLIASGRKVRVTPPEVLRNVRDHLAPFGDHDLRRTIGDVDVIVAADEIDKKAQFSSSTFTYADWIAPGSCLTTNQRRILEADGIERHPLRILGAGGSGKTLLLQLIAIRRLRLARSRGESIRVLYIVHNHAMAQMIKQRFDLLMRDEILAAPDQSLLEVKTLSEMACEFLELENANVINVDAHEAKEFQFDEVKAALQQTIENIDGSDETPLLRAAKQSPEAFMVLALLILSEISVAIKGRGLEKDRTRYVQSAKNLSRFHGVLNSLERNFVFSVFDAYHRSVFEAMEVLDSDDLAISLLGRLRTPIWELRRRHLGYDYVFVDETQLFNENERRIFPLITNLAKKHIPVVLALDEAQAVFAHSSAGFATLGIEGIASESLGSIHRSTKAIVDLAFFVIQRSTDLFGPDFPDFTHIAERLQPDDHPLGASPRIEYVQEQAQGLGKFVLKRVRELRKSNIRQICVVIHLDQYWDPVIRELQSSDLPLQLLLTRGERLPHDQPLVVVSKPTFVGGQEFDAVILVGLEQGLVPPRFIDNEALSSAAEQQALREIYVSLTRARYRVVVAVSYGSAVTGVFADAAHHGLIEDSKTLKGRS